VSIGIIEFVHADDVDMDDLLKICWRFVPPNFHKLSMLMNSTGIRISLYNAITEKETDLLIEYIKEFVRQEKGRAISGAA
jgi:hypothetical protein